ncbi:MAG: MoaD/ThiS family protein [Deltaproteobacteria bacterium]|nr:MoaD/ThiS family protein [Deltaproteobacteria bacterium]
MALRVEIGSYLRRYVHGYDAAQGMEVACEPGVTAGEVIRQLGIPEGEVSIITVNRSVARPDQELHDGDLIGVFPVAMGG